MGTKKLAIDHIARIEGHGSIQLSVDPDGKLDVAMHVEEPARHFEKMVVGRPYYEIPYIASRICGICSATHAVTDIIAIEKAFGIVPTKRTVMLRELLLKGSFLQNHATHLALLAAPDYLSCDSSFEVKGEYEKFIELGLKIKELGNELCNLIGGRSVHPICAVVGGFTSEPKPEDMLSLASKLESCSEECIEFSEFIAKFIVPDYKTKGDFLALVNDTAYCASTGILKTIHSEESFDSTVYLEHITEVSVGKSHSKLSHLASGSTYITGPIARINHSWEKLSKNARYTAAKFGLRPPVYEIFRNNECRAIELIDTCDTCASTLRLLANTKGDSNPVPFSTQEGTGIGCAEAPRGTLFHSLSFDKQGYCTAGNIVTPTAQNLANLEQDARDFGQIIIDYDEPSFKLQIEKLIRAYDPCLSCAVH